MADNARHTAGHTPGPWEMTIQKYPGAEKVIIGKGRDGNWHEVAKVHAPEDRPLVLAAPDLLAALKHYLEWDNALSGPVDTSEWDSPELHPIMQARAAIAKAQGRDA